MVVRKAANMAKHLNIPLLGLVENMSHAYCPQCGARIEVFGPSQAGETAQRIGTELLGSIPLAPEFAIMCDRGAIEDFLSEELGRLTSKVIELLPAKADTAQPAAKIESKDSR